MQIENYPGRHDFVLDGLAASSLDSVPVGNGEIGANLWLASDGLHILTARIDSLSGMNTLLKPAHVLVSFVPNPFDARTRLHLRLAEACVSITNGDAALRLFADANYPVYTLDATLPAKTTVTATLINHRKAARVLNKDDSAFNANVPQEQYTQIVDADVNYREGAHSVGQYHRNAHSIYDFTMDFQHLTGFPGAKDPFMGVTFGVLMQSDALRATDETTLQGQAEALQINIFTHRAQCGAVQVYLDEIAALADACPPGDRFAAHAAYWEAAWAKSYVCLWGSEAADVVSRGYTLQRYMNLCAGRGKLPVKFNGSIFTTEPDNGTVKPDYDFRLWGADYWFQNTRLVYWNAMLAGDYELCKPFFQYYLGLLPICEYRCQTYYGHDGAHFSETMTSFGAQRNYDYLQGKPRIPRQFNNPWIRWHFNAMLELLVMALWYYHHTLEEDFLQNTAIPLARPILTFFREHFEVWDDKLRLFPISSLETNQCCINDAPNIAGLLAVCEGFLALDIDDALRGQCETLLRLTPEMPLQELNGETVIAPCQVDLDTQRRNCENPELYAVFPFFRHTAVRGDLALALRTFENRRERRQPGWQTDGAQGALLGQAEETWEILKRRFSTWNKKCAFPAFWGPNYDYTPDQCHGAAASFALIFALLQSDENGVRYLPAWKKEINAAFRLPVYGGGWAEATLVDGELTTREFPAPQ